MVSTSVIDTEEEKVGHRNGVHIRYRHGERKSRPQ